MEQHKRQHHQDSVFSRDLLGIRRPAADNNDTTIEYRPNNSEMVGYSRNSLPYHQGDNNIPIIKVTSNIGLDQQRSAAAAPSSCHLTSHYQDASKNDRSTIVTNEQQQHHISSKSSNSSSNDDFIKAAAAAFAVCKVSWRPEEDEILKRMVQQIGPAKWRFIAEHLPGRQGKQCRERWLNHLDPTLKKGGWTAAENELLFQKQRQLGNKWSEIAKILPGRSENSVKNRWNALTRKRKREYEKRAAVTRKKPPPPSSSLLSRPQEVVADEYHYHPNLMRQTSSSKWIQEHSPPPSLVSYDIPPSMMMQQPAYATTELHAGEALSAIGAGVNNRSIGGGYVVEGRDIGRMVNNPPRPLVVNSEKYSRRYIDNLPNQRLDGTMPRQNKI